VKARVDLRAAHFEKPVDFGTSVFSNTVDLTDAVFEDQLSCTWCVFSDSLFLQRAQFVGKADFTVVHFDADIELADAVFNRPADFSYTRFAIAPGLQNVQFRRGGSFAGAVFKERSTFGRAVFGGRTWFTQADLTLVKFSQCRMDHVSLAGAHSISKAEFDDVEWGRLRRHRGPWRFVRRVRTATRRARFAPAIRAMTRRVPVVGSIHGAVLEERAAWRQGTPAGFTSAEHVYRELRRGFDERRMSSEAFRCQARELEMRRFAKGAGVGQPLAAWLRTNVMSLEALYWALGNYGSSHWRPLVWLLLLLITFPFAFALAGLEIEDVSYRLGPIDSSTWSAYWQLFGVGVRTAALQNDLPSLRMSPTALILQTLLRVAGPFLALLISVAVSRRFRS
jgi:hypothetical protein